MKHIEFYSKNKCEKLVHLVGFIIRICHDAQSSECQTVGFVRCISNIGLYFHVIRYCMTHTHDKALELFSSLNKTGTVFLTLLMFVIFLAIFIPYSYQNVIS